ncbi:MAG: DUF2232 domain-containing protein [bacterium]|nr:DUF2232 domain-containing protein [bacterium]
MMSNAVTWIVYAATWTVLFFVCGLTTLMFGPNVVGFGLFPVAVALYVVRRRFGFAAGLIACAGLGAFLALALRWALATAFAEQGDASFISDGLQGASVAAVYYAVMAACGVLLGEGIRRRWPYGRVVAAVAAAVFIVAVANIALAWDTWNADLDSIFELFESKLRSDQGQQTDEGVVALQLDMLNWLRDNRNAVAFGMNLAVILVLTCVAVSGTSKWTRDLYGEPGPRGCFREMRPPDWFVWIAIGVAVLWFADHRWPEIGIRLAAWNIGIGVGAIYWLNGLSVFLYGTHVLQPSILVYTAIVLILGYTAGVLPVPCFVGLFDTWGDFRRKCDAIAAARRERDSDDEN